MPLHLLGKKSWNVYNPANIARVKRDEAAAAAREEGEEQRMQELDAERRAAILRGRTPPPLPEDTVDEHAGRSAREDGGDRSRKRRKLAGEDDTDMDIRLATSQNDSTKARILKLRSDTSDAPLMDTTGHIDLFPVDMKEALKREKNAEAEAEKKKKEKALEDQYTMRFSNAAGRDGLDQPWYSAQRRSETQNKNPDKALELSVIESKDVWGNEDPLRKQREKARLTSNDPLAIMHQAQIQLKKSKEEKKKWASERKRELRELQDSQEPEYRRERHKNSKHRDKDGAKQVSSARRRHGEERSASSKHKHRRHRIHSPEISGRQPSHRSEDTNRHGYSGDRKRPR